MRVDPIQSKRHISAIKKLLHDNPRDLMLFTLGVNCGLRTQDMLSLKVSDFIEKRVGDRIVVKELKTGKQNVVLVNDAIAKCFKSYMEELEPDEDWFLFRSRKGVNAPISVHRVTGLLKLWTSEINLRGNYGAHTLRKTFCYVQRIHYGVPWEVLSKRLNHGSPSVTRRYIGVQDSEVEEILLNNI